jgi:cytochrome bd ubiquinol oxidase subunit II
MSLQVFWFVLIAILWGGYFVLEGFDFGVGMLLPFVPRDEGERGVLFDAIGPVWDGNEVWLVTAGAATFAAFPAWYGTMFSGLYLALLLVLVLLILRVVSFEWRSKSESPRWRTFWLWANAVGSAGAPLIWGVGLSNLLQGMPIDSSGNFTGNFASLFSGYTVLGGLTFVLLFAFHGATFLTLRTVGTLLDRCAAFSRWLALPATLVAAGFLIWTLVVAHDENEKSAFPAALPAIVAAVALVLALLLVRRGRGTAAFGSTTVAIAGATATLFMSLYPRVIVSSTNFADSLTVSGSASAHYSLEVMTVVACILLPVVLLYQGWTYYVFRARVTGGAASGPWDEQAAP